jgi:hypothetical protein
VNGDPNPRNNVPFTTNATGVATGLNADEVDGLDANEIQTNAVTAARPRRAVVSGTGVLNTTASSGVATAGRSTGLGDGTYDVVFTDAVTNCAYTATITEYENSGAAAVEALPDGKTIRVRTRVGGGNDGTGPTNVADKPFNLVVNC